VRRVSVVVVDDAPIWRAGFRQALAAEADIAVVAELADGATALAWLATATQIPDVAVVSWQSDALELTRQLRQLQPHMGVVLLSEHSADRYVLAALQAGAADFRAKEVLPGTLATVIRRVARGEYVINTLVQRPAVASGLLATFRALPDEAAVWRPLSEREIAVLEHIAAGADSADIARALGISVQTVKNHISAILRKLSLNDRTQAVIMALRSGWIAAPEGDAHGTHDDCRA